MSVAAWERAETAADFFTRKSASVGLAGGVAAAVADDTDAPAFAVEAAGEAAAAVEAAGVVEVVAAAVTG